MKKNKHLICDKLYNLLLDCKSENLGMISYSIKKCRKELQNLKPRPFMNKPEEVKIIKVSMSKFLDILNSADNIKRN